MTSRTAATRYARALFDVARAEGHDIEAIGRELAGFASLFTQHETFSRVMANPAIPAARKRAVVAHILAGNPVTPVVSRVLLLLAERDRLTLTPAVAAAYQSRLMDHLNIVRAEVTTAMPLPEDRVAALQAGLARATGRQVQLDVRVDPALVGGAVARIGSTIYDGSVMTQLEKLKQRLVTADV